MLGSIFTQEQERDKDAVIRDLQRQVTVLSTELKETERELSKALANVARLKRKLRNPYVVPAGDAYGGYECPNPGCYTTLTEDDTFCRGCGCEIDWRTWDGDC